MDQERYIDLHTHSTASDGSMSPTELVRHAYQKGLRAIAITDHDTIGGVEQALAEGGRLGIEVIPGVEISVLFSLMDFTSEAKIQGGINQTEVLLQKSKLSHESEMHLLGYFPNGNYGAIGKMLEELRKKREQRNPKIVKKLNELGFNITLSEANRLAPAGNVGRPHIAKVLVDKGYVASIEEAFEKYLSIGRPAYFKKEKLTPTEGISEITKAGGVPVLAHPIYLNLSIGQLDILLEQLIENGLKGIEAYYSENTEEQTKELLILAQKHKLLVTGGSDFHGKFKPDIEIGIGRGTLKVPYSLLAGNEALLGRI